MVSAIERKGEMTDTETTKVDAGMQGLITDEALAELRSRIGREFVKRTPPHLTEASKDVIRHWARGIGDRDPKWVDESYASKTRFGGITAPPSMLYGFDGRSIGDRTGLAGVHSFFAGADHEWYKPIRRNDTIDLKVVLMDVVEKPSRFAGRMFQQISECTFSNQDGEVVAKSWPSGMRVERRKGAAMGKYSELQTASYTPENIENIAEQYRQEHEFIRGSEPRYWEDTSVGDSLGPIIRGPWTPSVCINYLHATGGEFIQAHGEWYEYLERHPKAGILNEMGIPEGPVKGHWDSDFARRLGVPAAYDYGPERISWLASLCTYWCGDDGWLKRLNVRVKRFNFAGDLTTLEGRVTSKSVDEAGIGIVEAEVWARDQRGVDTATGTARIELPRIS
jgi:acyl dehydratase